MPPSFISSNSELFLVGPPICPRPHSLRSREPFRVLICRLLLLLGALRLFACALAVFPSRRFAWRRQVLLMRRPTIENRFQARNLSVWRSTMLHGRSDGIRGKGADLAKDLHISGGCDSSDRREVRSHNIALWWVSSHIGGSCRYIGGREDLPAEERSSSDISTGLRLIQEAAICIGLLQDWGCGAVRSV